MGAHTVGAWVYWILPFRVLMEGGQNTEILRT